MAMSTARFTPTTLSRAQALAHDEVYGDLASATRELADVQLRTRIPHAEARTVTDELRALVRRLGAGATAEPLGTELGHDGQLRNHGNPVCGLRNPFSFLTMGSYRLTEEGRMRWQVRLGALYEGPPGLVHGGVSAALLDHVVGEAASITSGLTMTGSLQLTYRRPTPLGEIIAEAWVTGTEGRRTLTRALILDSEGRVSVEADAVMVRPAAASIDVQ
jgi:acyl-coenzyme A thioesterase PaaI-like protein